MPFLSARHNLNFIDIGGFANGRTIEEVKRRGKFLALRDVAGMCATATRSSPQNCPHLSMNLRAGWKLPFGLCRGDRWMRQPSGRNKTGRRFFRAVFDRES